VLRTIGVVKRGKLCSEQGQIGGRGSGVRETGRSDGRGRAAQSSGRPLEPSGNRRPEMDDRRRGFGHGTELGLQAGSPFAFAEIGPPRNRRADAPRLISPRPTGLRRDGICARPYRLRRRQDSSLDRRSGAVFYGADRGSSPRRTSRCRPRFGSGVERCSV
jgi:hypothetical protein